MTQSPLSQSAAASQVCAHGVGAWSLCLACIDEDGARITQRSGAASKMQIAGTHYTDMPIQPWDVIDTWPLAERIAYYRGNALKYLMRLHSKDDPLTNAQKAGHYCAKLAEVLSPNPMEGKQ